MKRAAIALESETNEVDLLALQAVGQAFSPEVDWLVDFPVSVARGTVTSVKFNTQAAKLEDLFDLPALHVTGSVGQCRSVASRLLQSQGSRR